MRIVISSLGLAAYLKANGAVLVKVTGGDFEFESDRDAEDWRISYSNSCCALHDSAVCNLRRLRRHG